MSKNASLVCSCIGTGKTSGCKMRISVHGGLSFVNVHGFDLDLGKTLVGDGIGFRPKTGRRSHPVRNRSPCLVGTNFFCRRTSDK